MALPFPTKWIGTRDILSILTATSDGGGPRRVVIVPPPGKLLLWYIGRAWLPRPKV